MLEMSRSGKGVSEDIHKNWASQQKKQGNAPQQFLGNNDNN